MKLLLLLTLIWGQDIYAEVVEPITPQPPVGHARSEIPQDQLPQLEEMNTAPNPVPNLEDDKNMDTTLDAGKVRTPSSEKEKQQQPDYNTSPNTKTTKPLGPNKM